MECFKVIEIDRLGRGLELWQDSRKGLLRGDKCSKTWEGWYGIPWGRYELLNWLQERVRTCINYKLGSRYMEMKGTVTITCQRYL